VTAGLPGTDPRQPLAGYRVLELTEVWAGPFGTSVLGDLGAEVIRVESFPRASMTRPVGGPFAGARMIAGEPDAPRPWDRSPGYHVANRNKLGIALNAVHPRGHELLLRLVALTDALVIGYSAGTVARMGLDYATLQKLKPDLVMVSMPGWGEAGPYQGFATLGSGLDAFAGHHYLRSYPDLGPASVGGIFHSDATGAVAVAFAVMSGLYYRERAGAGQYIDLSQAEVLLSHLPGPLFDWTLNRRARHPVGNADPEASPHGCYPCREPDSWVVIAARTQAQWQALVEVMGRPDWALQERFQTLAGRIAYRDELDAALAGWTRERTPLEVFECLAAAGVPAGPVYNTAELLSDRHLAARSFFHEVDYPELKPFPRPGPIWRLSRTPSAVRRETNLLGEHNREVLGGLLGLDEAAIETLEREGIIGDSYKPGSEA
jgi:crotonobetainyl-CoA:carnitine CoA-transferase CaiB-like acyl-CoA transferase